MTKLFCSLLCILLLVDCAAGQMAPAPAVLLVPQRPHTDAIISAAITPNGRMLVTGSSDGSVKLWDLETGALLRTLPGYEGARLRVRGGGAFLLAGPDLPKVSGADSGGRKLTSQLWDLKTGQLLLDADKIALADTGVAAIAEANDQGRTERIRLVEARTGRSLRELASGAESVMFMVMSPDGTVLATVAEKSATLWDVATGRKLRTIPLPGAELFYEARFSLDGATLAVGFDKAVALVPVGQGNVVTFPASGYSLFCDGRRVAVTPHDAPISVIDMATRRVEKKIDDGHSPEVTFDPRGERLAVQYHGEERRVEVWDAASWTRLWSRPGVYARGFSGDGATLALGSRGSLELADARTGATTGRLDARNEKFFFSSVYFSPSNDLVVATDFDRGAAVWRVSDGALRRSIPTSEDWVTALAMSPDGKRLATANGRSMRLWDLESGVPTERADPPATGEHDKIVALSFVPTGDGLAVDFDSSVYLWSLEKSTYVGTAEGGRVFSRDWARYAREADNGVEVYDTPTGRLVRAIPNAMGPFAFDESGASIVVQALGGSAALERIDIETGRSLGSYRVHETAFSELSISPDGRLLVASYGGQRLSAAIAVFDMATGRLLKKLAPSVPRQGIEGFYNLPTVLAFSPDGRWLAVGNIDSSVELWETDTLTFRRRLSGHTGVVSAATFSPDGRVAYTGGIDGTVRVWATETGEELGALLADGEEWIAVAPDGRFDGSPGGWDRMLWSSSADVSDASLAEVFFNDFYEPGLLAEIAAGRRRPAARTIADLDRRQPRVALRAVGAPGSGPAAARTVDVEIEVAEAPPGAGRTSGSGARDVRLFRNGALVRSWHGDALAGGSTAVLRAEKVPIVAGENRFTAYAFNAADIKSQTAELTIVGAEGLRRQGTLYIVAVGVNRYANPGFDLKYAVKDAEAFGETLARAQRDLGEMRETVLVTLRDAEATKRNVELALARLGGAAPEAGAPAALEALRAAEPEDVVVFYFAGHGTAYGGRFYLIPHDLGYEGARAELDVQGMETIAAHGVSDRDLEAGLERIDAKEILLVIDACNSGQALESEERRQGPMNSKGLAQLAYEKGMYVLAAAQSYQAALEAQRLGHGYLTYALVEEGIGARAADAWPKDGVVRLAEWLRYAVERVPAMQAERLREARDLQLGSAFVEGEEKEPPERRNVQRPRAFVKRGAASRAPVVARF